jgi:hypothetical protein
MHALLDAMGALQPGIQYLRPSPPSYVQQLTRERRDQSTAQRGPDAIFQSDVSLPPDLGGVVVIEQAPQQ